MEIINVKFEEYFFKKMKAIFHFFWKLFKENIWSNIN